MGSQDVSCKVLQSGTWPRDRTVYVDMKIDQDTSAGPILRAFTSDTTVRILRIKNVHKMMPCTMELLEDVIQESKGSLDVTVEAVRTKQGVLPTALFPLFSNLNKLSLMKCRIDQKAFKALAETVIKSYTLKSLKLLNLMLEGDWTTEFADIQEDCSPNYLTELVAENISLTEGATSCLFDAFANIQSLKTLRLEHMNLGSTTMPKVVEVVRKNKQLRDLSLRGNNFQGRSLKSLCEYLRSDTSIRVLSLALNPVGDQGASYLVQALQQNSTLQELDLEESEIWHKGCSMLAKGLSNMKGIRRILLDGNDIEFCACEILKSLQTNMTVTYISGTSHLGLKGDEDEVAKQWKEIEYWLGLNRANRQISTMINALPLWPLVLESANSDPQMMYHMLRHAPHIFDTRRS